MCIQTLEASSHPGRERWRPRNRFFEFDSPSKYNTMPSTTNNTYSPLSSNHVSRNTQWRMWLVAAWSIHFLVTISITVYGTMSNHGERYEQLKEIPCAMSEENERRSTHHSASLYLFSMDSFLHLKQQPMNHLSKRPTACYRKYIPVDIERTENGENCLKAFVDVFAESLDAPGALVCCSSTSQLQPNGASALCSSPVSQQKM
jgi:hypothetical protein